MKYHQMVVGVGIWVVVIISTLVLLLGGLTGHLLVPWPIWVRVIGLIVALVLVILELSFLAWLNQEGKL